MTDTFPRAPGPALREGLLDGIPRPLEVDEAAYDRLAVDVRGLVGIDLRQYKPAQVWRRVNAFAAQHGQPDPSALVDACRRDRVLQAAFRDMLTINVSEFFRNPTAFAELHQRFLAPMLRRPTTTRIWSAGCSTGFEPYTLAMLARETAPGAAVRIRGTDIDATALARAMAGRYPEAQMAGVSTAQRHRFFARDGNDWTVKPEVRSMVEFSRHDLLHDPYGAGYDLVVCRNVVIYFTEAAKSSIFSRFAASLRPGGILFIGATEAIHDPRSMGLTARGVSFYERAQ